MKKLRIAVLLVTVISLLGLVLACDTGGGSPSPTEVPKTPKLSDYQIEGIADIFVDDPFPAVSVTPNADASPGAVTKKYNGNTSAPSTATAGAVTVTFDVAAAPGWVGIEGFSAGTVIINRKDLKIPEFKDFTITGLTNGSTVIKVDDPLAQVTVAPVSTDGTIASQGAITVSYLKGGLPVEFASIRTSAGEYEVRFSVAIDNANKWNAANFRAGIITVNPKDQDVQVTPIDFQDFDVKLVSAKYGTNVAFTAKENSGSPLLSDFSGEPQVVVVTPKTTGAASGYDTSRVGAVVLTYYTVDASGGNPQQIGDARTNVGNYKVNVKIAGFVTPAAAWSGAEFNLWYNIRQRTPKASDYVITRQNQSEAGNLLQSGTRTVQHLSIVRKPTYKPAPNQDQVDQQGIASKGKLSIFYEYVGPASQDPDVTKWDGTLEIDPTITDSSAQGYIAPPQKAGTYKVYLSVAAPSTSYNPADGDYQGNANATDIANWGPATKLTSDDLVLVLAPLVPVLPQVHNFWIDESSDKLQVSTGGNLTLALQGDPIVFNMTPGNGVTVFEWRVDGKVVPGNTTNTYTFSSNAVGRHNVSILVLSGGKLYSETVEVRVQTKE